MDCWEIKLQLYQNAVSINNSTGNGVIILNNKIKLGLDFKGYISNSIIDKTKACGRSADTVNVVRHALIIFQQSTWSIILNSSTPT